jgi:hypothetical protein
MRLFLSASFLILVATSLFAHDSQNRKPKPMIIATTGRIVAIDTKARTMTLSHSAGPAILLLAPSGLDEFIVVTTTDTLFQDGADPIRFEDFKLGDTISVHGKLRGSVLRASRVAKWD